MSPQKYIIFLCMAVFAMLPSAAQPPVPDSLSVNLDEVTVKATPVIRKYDRDVYLPSSKTKEQSSGGLSLLTNMQLPGVGINDYMKQISVNGETPELRINNRRATIENVMSLNSEWVSKVEIIHNPGVRYGNVPVVINIIVKNPETGGYVRFNGEQALHRYTFSNYDGTVSLNHGPSQFQLDGYISLRKNVDTYRNYYERFLNPAGDITSRIMTDTLGRGEVMWNNVIASYSYSRPDKINIYASLKSGRDLMDQYYEGRIESSGRNLVYDDRSISALTTPGAHFYLDYNLGRKQTLIFDIDGGLGLGHSQRTNGEQLLPHHEPVISINNNITNRSGGFSAEAIYVKEWDASSFTAGSRYRMSRNREKHHNESNSTRHQRTDRTSFFAEYMRKFGSVTLTGGLNGEFWSNNYVEDGRSVNDFMLTPGFSLAWNINQTSSLRLNYSAYSTLPSLTETSDVVQTIDAFQIQKGNPDLKPYTTYDIVLRYSFSIPRLSGSIYGSWSRLPGAIMEYSSFDSDGKIVNSWENAVGATRYRAGVSPRITIVPNFLTINGTVEFRHFRNHVPITVWCATAYTPSCRHVPPTAVFHADCSM